MSAVARIVVTCAVAAIGGVILAIMTGTNVFVDWGALWAFALFGTHRNRPWM